MIRPYKLADKKQLLKMFISNVPEFFDVNEINDFKEYLEQNAATYLTVEVDNTIVGGAGYFINEHDKSGRITWIFLTPRIPDKDSENRQLNIV